MAGFVGIAAVSGSMLAAPGLPGRLEIEWEAPPGCRPGREEFAARVARLGGPGDAQRPVHGRAVVAAEAAHWRLDLALSTPRSEVRSLTASDCEVLTAAAALIVAVAADPVAVATEHPPPRTARPTATPPPRLRAPRPPAPERTVRAPESPPAPRKRTRARSLGLRIGLRPETGVSGGTLPGVGPGVGGAVALLGRRFRVELGGSHWFARNTDIRGTPGVGGRLSLSSASARGCGVARGGPFEFPVCIGLEAGAMLARGRGVPSVRSSRSAWLGLAAGMSLVWAPLDWLAPFVRVEGVLGLRRPTYHLEGVGRVYTVGAGGARGSVGIELRFL